MALFLQTFSSAPRTDPVPAGRFGQELSGRLKAGEVDFLSLFSQAFLAFIPQAGSQSAPCVEATPPSSQDEAGAPSSPIHRVAWATGNSEDGPADMDPLGREVEHVCLTEAQEAGEQGQPVAVKTVVAPDTWRLMSQGGETGVPASTGEEVPTAAHTAGSWAGRPALVSYASTRLVAQGVDEGLAPAIDGSSPGDVAFLVTREAAVAPPPVVVPYHVDEMVSREEQSKVAPELTEGLPESPVFAPAAPENPGRTARAVHRTPLPLRAGASDASVSEAFTEVEPAVGEGLLGRSPGPCLQTSGSEADVIGDVDRGRQREEPVLVSQDEVPVRSSPTDLSVGTGGGQAVLGHKVARETTTQVPESEAVTPRDVWAVARTIRQEASEKLPRTVELRLDPPELGSVTVLLSQRGQDVTVKLTVSTGEGHKALTEAAGDLVRALSENGLTLTGFSVDPGYRHGGRREKESEVARPGARRRTGAIKMVPSPAERGLSITSRLFDCLA